MKTKSKIRYPKALSICVLFILAFTLAGCTSNSNKTTTDKVNGPSSEKGETAETTEDDKYGGTLKIVLNETILNIGLPPLINIRGEEVVVKPVYETLARFDERGKAVPWLAEGWESDYDTKTIKMALKQGIKFHDGTDFNAEAAKWNLEFYREKKRIEAKAIESIDVIDEYNLKINLSNWDTTIFDNLFTYAFMTSPTAYEKNGEEWLQEHPVGTGPFVFDKWIKGEKAIFTRNENYWINGLPYLDAVEFHTITEPATAEAAMMAGQYDLYMYISPRLARNLEKNFEIEVLENAMGASGISLAPDSENPNSPLSNVNVRKAIGYAIDKEAIVDTVYYGYGEVIHQWSVAKASNFNRNVVGTPYDPEKARELLASAGYGDGFDLPVTFYTTPEMTQMYTAIQAYLGEVGINVRLNPLQRPQFNEVNKSTWEGLINCIFRISNDVTFDFNRTMAANSPLYRMTHLSEEAENLLGQAKTVKTPEELIELSQQLQKVIFDEHQTSIPIAVINLLLAQTGNVQDHGLLKTQSTEWTPERTWLKE